MVSCWWPVISGLGVYHPCILSFLLLDCVHGKKEKFFSTRMEGLLGYYPGAGGGAMVYCNTCCYPHLVRLFDKSFSYHRLCGFSAIS